MGASVCAALGLERAAGCARLKFVEQASRFAK